MLHIFSATFIYIYLFWLSWKSIDQKKNLFEFWTRDQLKKKRLLSSGIFFFLNMSQHVRVHVWWCHSKCWIVYSILGRRHRMWGNKRNFVSFFSLSITFSLHPPFFVYHFRLIQIIHLLTEFWWCVLFWRNSQCSILNCKFEFNLITFVFEHNTLTFKLY